jgi:hypothetical protein
LIFFREKGDGEGSVYSSQQTGVIDDNPVVKIQSASTSPGIAISPRAVVQVPMPDDGSTGSGAAVTRILRLYRWCLVMRRSTRGRRMNRGRMMTKKSSRDVWHSGMQSSSSKHSTYGLSENEKVLSAVVRWGLYHKGKDESESGKAKMKRNGILSLPFPL